MATATITGTIINSTRESDIVDGGRTIIITLSGVTWHANIGTSSSQTTDLINGLDSAQAEGTGWDAVVKAGLTYSNIVRTSDTVVTITLPAFASYNITATETITFTIPASAQSDAAPGTYTPPTAPAAIKAVIDTAATHYNLPRWFLYAIVARESSFDPNAYNENGGYGLTQLTGAWYSGVTYPQNLLSPNNNNAEWRDNMGLDEGGAYTNWITMNNVTAITTAGNRFDPTQNMNRFCSGYASAAFYWAQARYPTLDNNEALQAVAYHWNHGIFLDYLTDPDNPDYLTEYDAYVAVYRPAVEAEDGVWNGLPNVT